ncbi:MAG: amino acid adenylation domain-containing protein [Phycisphaeraceae bacterium]|nr:MAG: amino acid adenylation domain-containing protein [Phycisphaeraceae bacterium]
MTEAGRDSVQDVGSAFALIARAYMGAVAASERDRGLTYGDLDADSAAIAHALGRMGLMPGERVLVALPRGLDYLRVVVAIVRAGGVYVPVDPAWPPERLEQIARITRPVLTVAPHGWSTLRGAVAIGDLDGQADAFDPPPIGRDSPCYVMFTSGTTGEPKGVVVPHRAVLRLVVGPDAYDVGPDRAWLHLSSTSFDASTLEIWAPLLNGGRCITVPDTLPSLDRIAEILRETGTTDAWLTASLFNAVVDHAPDAFSGLRQVLTGGERLSGEHVRRFLRRWPDIRLINGYGPTENTTFTCCRTIEPADADDPGGVPIGLPIRGTEVRLVDDRGLPVDDGEPGELVAGGDGVALGYLGDEALTAARFVTLPGGEGLWYRTGDFARRRADGLIEFLGRRDRQVKVRGHRIELEEVEAQIAACPGVTRALAMTIGDRADLNRLAAAYTAGAEPLASDDLRAFLIARLPRHLVPDVLCPLERIPVGPTGKVALDAVRELILRAAAPSVGLSAQEGWRELVGLLAEVLPGAAAEPDGSFIAIGGHSIAALRLAAGLRARHGVRVEVGRILGCEALGELAEAIACGPGPAEDGGESDEAGPVLAASMQQQFFFEQALDPTRSAYHEFAAFRAGAGLDVAALEAAWRGLVARHEILRTRLELRDDRLLQHIDPPEAAHNAEFGVHALIEWPDDRTPDEAAAVLNTPFDLERAHSARLHVFVLRDGTFGVVLVFHHMAVDEWSLGLIADDLGTLYRGESLSPAVQFRRFSEHERRARTDAETECVAERLLAVSPPRATLGRAPAPATRRPVLSGLTTSEVERRATGLGCTPSAFLLAVYGRAICEVFDRQDVAILTPLSRRTGPDLQRVVGCCNTMHPIVFDGRDPDLRRATRGVQRAFVEAYDRPIAPFSEVMRAAQRKARGRGFNVEFGFAYQTRTGFRPDMGGVEIGPLRCPDAAARFPLAMLLHTEADRVVGALAASAGSEGESHLHDLEDAIERVMLGPRRSPVVRVSIPGRESDQVPVAAAATPGDESLRREAAGAWAALVGSPPSSDNDDFFDRGGHSLLLLRLVARIKAATGVEPAMGPFLERPVFGRLVRCLQDAQQAEEQAGRTFRVVELHTGEQTILALPGAIGRPIVFSRMARELAERGPGAPGLLCYDLFEPLSRLGPADGLDRVLNRLLGDLHRPDVVGLIGFSVGGLLPLFLNHLSPEVERRVHLWLVDVFHPSTMRGAEVRSRQSLVNAIHNPHRVPLALYDTARIARRVLRKNLLHEEELGLDLLAIEKLRVELRRRSMRVWRGRATVFVAGRKPIWQPHFDEREMNGMSPYLGGPIERVIIPQLHQDLLTRGARRIVRRLIGDLARGGEGPGRSS